MSAAFKRKCVFVDKPCEVESDSIPLEVCRLCLDAWKVRSSTIMVSRTAITPEVPPKPMLERSVEVKPAETETKESKSMAEQLGELDRLLFEGKINVEDYLERRKKIVNSVASPTNWLKQMEERWFGRQAQPLPYAILVEGGRAKTFYPESWRPPEALIRILKPLYEICRMLNERSIRLHAEDFKIEVLGYRDGKLALLFLDEGQSFSDFDRIIEEAKLRLKASSSWEEALKTFYEDQFGRRQLKYIS
jgi:hypothetical protein